MLVSGMGEGGSGALDSVAGRSRKRDSTGVELEVNKTKTTVKAVMVSDGGEKGNCSLLLVVHGVHGCGSLIIGRVADETETAAAASVTVLDDGLRVNKSEWTRSGGRMGRKGKLTASSTTPNSSKRWRRDWSSVPQERPLETENGQYWFHEGLDEHTR